MTSSGQCHVCKKNAFVFEYTSPYESGKEHEGYWHCKVHGPIFVREYWRHQELINQAVKDGHFNEGDLTLETNDIGHIVIVDHRDPELLKEKNVVKFDPKFIAESKKKAKVNRADRRRMDRKK